MHSIKYLIIGAGISGLAFATQKKHEEYFIIEKESLPGGLCQSFYEKGFIWDVAGHFFHFHSETTKEYYDRLMKGKIQRTVTKCAKVYYGGQYMNAPFQYNIHQLPTEEFIECLTDLYFANCPEGNIPFEEFVKKKYGNGISNKFLIPYNEKLYACNMNDLERDSMGNFLPKLDFSMLMNFYIGSKGHTYNDTFSYPVNGCVEIINALMTELDRNKISFNEVVERVDIDKKIVYTNKDSYRYEYLINTAALSAFATMTGDKDPECLNYNQVLVLNIGFDKESIDKQVSWVYYPGNEIFYRVGFYNNIAGTNQLSIYVEISYRAKEKIDIEEAMLKTIEDLKRVRVIDDHKVVAYNSYIINPGYAHITTKGKAYTDKMIADLKQKNIFMVGRYARWEYSAMDDSLEQSLELSKII